MHIQIWTDDDEELLDDLTDFRKPRSEAEMNMLLARVREMLILLPTDKN